LFLWKPNDNIQNLIFLLEHRCNTDHLRGGHQTEFAVEYMRDLALEHYRANFSHLARTPEWEIVKQSFLKQFVPFNNEVKLRVDLDHLRQSGSGPDAYFTYVHDFKHQVNRLTQISETEQMLYFINGLQRYTQSRVQEFCPTTSEECMQRTSAIECNQFRYNKSPSKITSNSHSSPKRTFSSSTHTQSSSKPSASATPKSSITCFKCKQHGHYSNVCTNREMKFANLAH
jgi:hypothetical protein